MNLGKIFKNTFLVIVACLALSACATQKKVDTVRSNAGRCVHWNRYG